MASKGGLTFGIGINDANYVLYRTVQIDGKNVNLWVCPVYTDWYSMLRRAACPKFKEKNPSYKDVTVCEEWKSFMAFRKWVLEEQPNKNWENCCLDKDLLVKGNKEYSPLTCIYVDSVVNSFFAENKHNRGKYPTGVFWKKKNKKFQAQCNNPFAKSSGEKRGYIGLFDCPIAAHKAWARKKIEYAVKLRDLQLDKKVVQVFNEYIEQLKLLVEPECTTT